MFKNILVILILLLLIDAIWLSYIKDMYMNQIEIIQKKQVSPNLISAALVYVLLAIGLYYFTKDEVDIKEKVVKGVLLGLVSYGVYDFTNGALFSDWNMKIAVADTLWGGILMGSTAYVSHKLLN